MSLIHSSWSTYRALQELERDTRAVPLPKEGYDLYVAAVCNDAVKFKEVLKRPEVQAFLLDPDKGVKNLVLCTRDTLVHSMAMQSADCLQIFLEFCRESIANFHSRKTQINAILLTHICSDLHPIIYDYIEKQIDYVSIAALDLANGHVEPPLLKAVFDINIKSVELLLNYPGYPYIYHEYIMQRALFETEYRQSLIDKGIELSGEREIRVRFGLGRNPDCENPLLKLTRIIKAAAAKYLGKTIIGDTPLIDDYF